MLKATKADCVIFDLDGTLVDSAPDLLNTLNTLFRKIGRREITLEEIRGTIGHGARAMIREGAALTGEPLSDEMVEELYKGYLDHYGQNLAAKSAPFDGADDVLETLKKEKVAIAVCTNKLEGLTHALLQAFGIAHYFDVVVGLDTLERPKPHPDPVLEILKRTGARAEKTIFVGDSETDLKTARAANVMAVLVDYGYTATPVTELKPDRIIQNLRDIL